MVEIIAKLTSQAQSNLEGSVKFQKNLVVSTERQTKYYILLIALAHAHLNKTTKL